MQPTISVVIPVYNRFDCLKRSVESVLAQTLPVSEVILVDDGSIDGTSELLPRYIAENQMWRDRVSYVHQDNQGPNVARNTALDRAVVTRAHGSAQGKSSTRTPHLGHSTRRGRYRSFSGNFRIDRSRQTRA